MLCNTLRSRTGSHHGSTKHTVCIQPCPGLLLIETQPPNGGKLYLSSMAPLKSLFLCGLPGFLRRLRVVLPSAPPATQMMPQSIWHLGTCHPVSLVLPLECQPHFLRGIRNSLCTEPTSSPLSVSAPLPTPSRH